MTEAPVPDTTADDEDLHCPVCDYALRGLPEPRCPECGYAFEWAELREKARLRKGWFYEHAGTRWSHLRTRWRSLRPWSFWKEIHAYTDTDQWRLWRYQATTLALLLAVAVMMLGISPFQEWLRQNLPQARSSITTVQPKTGQYRVIPNYSIGGRYPWPSSSPSRPYATTRAYSVYTPPPLWAQWLRPFAGPPRSYGYRNNARIWIPALMTAATALGLAVYWRLLRGSVLRASIRPVHLSRVAAYSTDALPLLLAFYAVVGWLVWNQRPSYGYPFSANVVPMLIGPWLVVVPLTLRLASALRRYVRFPQAWAVALGYGVIVGLAWIIVELRATF